MKHYFLAPIIGDGLSPETAFRVDLPPGFDHDDITYPEFDDASGAYEKDFCLVRVDGDEERTADIEKRNGFVRVTFGAAGPMAAQRRGKIEGYLKAKGVSVFIDPQGDEQSIKEALIAGVRVRKQVNPNAVR